MCQREHRVPEGVMLRHVLAPAPTDICESDRPNIEHAHTISYQVCFQNVVSPMIQCSRVRGIEFVGS